MVWPPRGPKALILRSRRWKSSILGGGGETAASFPKTHGRKWGVSPPACARGSLGGKWLFRHPNRQFPVPNSAGIENKTIQIPDLSNALKEGVANAGVQHRQPPRDVAPFHATSCDAHRVDRQSRKGPEKKTGPRAAGRPVGSQLGAPKLTMVRLWGPGRDQQAPRRLLTGPSRPGPELPLRRRQLNVPSTPHHYILYIAAA